MPTPNPPAPLTCQAEHQCSQGEQRAEHPRRKQRSGKKGEASTAPGVLPKGICSLATSALSCGKTRKHRDGAGNQGQRAREGRRPASGRGSHASRPLRLPRSNRSTDPVLKRRRGFASSLAPAQGPVHPPHRGANGPGGSSRAGGAGRCPGEAT